MLRGEVDSGNPRRPWQGYGPNYLGAPRFLKIKSHIWISTSMNVMPQSKVFDYIYVNELNMASTICFYENSSWMRFCAKSLNKF